MQKDAAQKILFIINPVSGGKGKQEWESFLRDYFRQQPHTLEFYLLTGSGDAVSVHHHIEAVNPDKIVAVGGDGTVKLVAELIKGTHHVLGILPAGSANGMARELNLPLDKNEALEVVLHGECRPIDVISINEAEICIHLSDMGLNAMLVKYFEESPGRGMWGYGKSVFKMFWNKHTLHATLKMDGQTLHRRAYMIVLANARKYGTGATINPDGKLDDGHFEVVVVRRLNFWSIVKVLLSRRNFKERNIEIISCSELQLTTLRKHYFQVDGEYRGKLKEVRARILPRCLNVMLPVAPQ